MQSATIEDLKTVIALRDLPDEHLQWLIDHLNIRSITTATLLENTDRS
jgi:hypothetical protein